MNRIFAAFFCLLTSSYAPVGGMDIPALAIVSNDSATELQADLLTAELSHTGGVQLLERTEIARILREQQFSRAQRNHLELGKLLGADGLIVLESTNEGTNQFLIARLVAVGPGVILDESIRPVTKDLQWAKWTSSHLAPLLPKLLVLEKDAVPISLLNLRAAVSSSEAIELENRLKTLAVRRLLREPSFFVLERDRMKDLAAEKDFGLRTSAFWNGSYLLEGVIDRDGYHAQTITLHARLLAPKGGQPLPIEVTSTRTNLSSLVDQLALEVASSLKLKSADASWNAAEEANSFFEEAKWAFAWQMYPEAAAATEASWALGKEISEVAEMRARIYQIQAAPKWRDYRLPSAETCPPDPNQLAAAARALLLCNDGVQRFVLADQKPTTNWYALSLHVLETSSDLLRHFYLLPDFREGRDDDLANVRALARELVARLKAHPAYRGFVIPGTFVFRVGDETGVDVWSSNFDLRAIEIAKGAYWQENPEDVIEIYRVYAHAGELPALRTYLTRRHLIGWTAPDKVRVPRLWTNFVQELCTSTNPLLRVEGRYIAYTQVRKSPDLESTARAGLLQVAIENAAELKKAGSAEKLLKDIERIIPNNRAEAKSNEAFRDEFERMIVRGMVQALASELKSDRILIPRSLYTEFYDRRLEAAQASELLELVKAREGKFEAKSATLPPAELKEWKSAGMHLRNFRGFLEKRISPATEVTLQTKKAEPPPQAPATLTNLMRIDRFWRMPESVASPSLPSPEILQAFMRDDRFWMAVRSHGGRIVLFQIDPVTFEHDSIEIPPDLFEGKPVFEVLGSCLYLASPGGVSRYDFAQKTWRKSVLPLENNARSIVLATVHGRIILGTPDSILELSPERQSAEILASRRRNPPVHVLDRLPFYRASSRSGTVLFEGAKGNLRTVINGRLYTEERASRSWREGASWPFSPNHARWFRSADGLIYQTVNGLSQSEWWCMSKESDVPQLVLSEVATNALPPKTWWAIPPKLRLGTAPVHLEKENLWMLAGDLVYEWYRNYEGSLRTTEGCHAQLVRFQKDVPQPETTPLWLELGDLKLHFDDLAETSRPTPQGNLSMFPLRPSIYLAASGFIVIGKGIPGFWLIPLPNSQPVKKQLHQTSAMTESPDAELLVAAETGDIQKARNALDRGANVDARTERGWTALMLSAYAGYKDIVSLLVVKGANVNAKSLSEKGDFVLAFAVGGGHPEIVELLLDKGAVVKARGGPYNSSTALFHAVVRTNFAVAELLIEHGGDVNDEGRPDTETISSSLLRIAVRRGAADLARLLLSKGATIDKQNDHGETALHAAARHPSSESLRVLIENRCSIDPVNVYGNTPLHYAAYLGRMKNVEFLLAAGANATAIGKIDGKSYDAAGFAESRRFEEVAALIRSSKTTAPETIRK